MSVEASVLETSSVHPDVLSEHWLVIESDWDALCGCRQLFYELRVAVEVMCSKPQCPQCVFTVVVGSCSMSCVWPWRWCVPSRSVHSSSQTSATRRSAWSVAWHRKWHQRPTKSSAQFHRKTDIWFTSACELCQVQLFWGLHVCGCSQWLWYLCSDWCDWLAIVSVSTVCRPCSRCRSGVCGF